MQIKIETQEKIERHLQIICNVFLKEGGWRYASGLYLIGGFARGEGTADIFQNDLRIYNDLDLLVVIKKKDPWTLLSLQKILSRINDGRFPFVIDFVFRSKLELNKPEPSILNFDIQNHHRHLWGEDPLSQKKKLSFDSKQPSLKDVLQLLLNRQASLLIGLSMIQKDDPNKAYIQVQLSKPISAMLVALQILEGNYDSSEMNRIKWVKNQMGNKKLEPLWAFLQDSNFKHLLNEYESFKTQPQPEQFIPFKENVELLKKIYSDFIYIFMIKLYKLSSDISRDDLVKHFCSKQGKQWDLFSFSWWVARYRARPDRIKLRLGSGFHLHVQAYASHLLWMNDSPKWQEFISWYDSAKDQSNLELMVNAWKVSGYGCQLQ